MNKKELIDALDSLGMRPGRGLGQNFLLDGNLLDWIVRNCGAAKDDENVYYVRIKCATAAEAKRLAELLNKAEAE